MPHLRNVEEFAFLVREVPGCSAINFEGVMPIAWFLGCMI